MGMPGVISLWVVSMVQQAPCATHRLLLLKLCCGRHLGCELTGPNRVNDR